MKNNTVFLSIIIVSWNVIAYLREALESIYAYPPKENFEVIVVDNASSDGTPDMITEFFPNIVLIANSENVGFAKGNNIGLKSAIGKYILFLNPDTKLLPKSLDLVIKRLEEDSNIGAIGCKQFDSNNKVRNTCRQFPSLLNQFSEISGLAKIFPKSNIWGKYLGTSFDYTMAQETDQPEGSFLAIPKQILNEVGPFSENFYMYYDEVDLCFRIKKSGRQIWYFPDIEIFHYQGKSSGPVYVHMIYESSKSLIIYYKKNKGMFKANVLKLIISIVLASKLIFLGVIGIALYSAEERKIKRAKAIAVLRAIAGLPYDS